MKRDKFLTVMAVLDAQTQYLLRTMQNEINKSGLSGTHTADVPFHVSLGSFPVECKESLISLMRKTSINFGRFNIELTRFADFNGEVLFLEPQPSAGIDELHAIFDGNYSDGMPFHPHVTLFCGDELSVQQAKSILGTLQKPITAAVTGLLIGEFFPTNLLAELPLNG